MLERKSLMNTCWFVLWITFNNGVCLQSRTLAPNLTTRGSVIRAITQTIHSSQPFNRETAGADFMFTLRSYFRGCIQTSASVQNLLGFCNVYTVARASFCKSGDRLARLSLWNTASCVECQSKNSRLPLYRVKMVNTIAIHTSILATETLVKLVTAASNQPISAK